jgi:hypothetical protein
MLLRMPHESGGRARLGLFITSQINLSKYGMRDVNESDAHPVDRSSTNFQMDLLREWRARRWRRLVTSRCIRRLQIR